MSDSEEGVETSRGIVRVTRQNLENIYHLNDPVITLDSKERTARVPTKKTRYRKWLGGFVNNVWSVDLMDMHYSSDINEHFKYLFVAVDVYSRYAFVIPMENKNQETCHECFRKCFKMAHEALPDKPADEVVMSDDFPVRTIPNKVAVDEESGIKTLDWFFRLYNIAYYNPHGKAGSAIAESFIRNLKERLSPYVNSSKEQKWFYIVSKCVKEYNNTIHHALKGEEGFYTPKEVYTGVKTYEEAREPNKLGKKDVTEQFKVNDIVRFKYNKSLLPMKKKSLTPNYSKDLFKITGIKKNAKPYGYNVKRLTNRGQPRKTNENAAHIKEINDADKRLFYHHELKQSEMKPEQVRNLRDEKTL